jgi:hypothetical protein
LCFFETRLNLNTVTMEFWMGDREEPRDSWWKTMPGVLTAIAGVLTAATGLIVGLHQAGLLNGEAVKPAPPQTEQQANAAAPASPAPAAPTASPTPIVVSRPAPAADANDRAASPPQPTASPGSETATAGEPQRTASPAAASWVAVATSETGHWGASIRPDGADAAAADALRRCGEGCRVAAQGPGHCVAVVTSQTGGIWFGYAYGNDRDKVQSIAWGGCEKGAPAGTCRLEHVNCS